MADGQRHYHQCRRCETKFVCMEADCIFLEDGCADFLCGWCLDGGFEE